MGQRSKAEDGGELAAPSKRARVPSLVWVGIIVLVFVVTAVWTRRVQTEPASVISQESSTAVASAALPQPVPPKPSGPPVHSQIVDLTLPGGSARTGDASTPGLEIWKMPVPYLDAVADIRDQLPVTTSYDGLPWCGKNTKARTYVEWTWGSHDDFVGVTVSDAAGGAEVAISRGPDPAGC